MTDLFLVAHKVRGKPAFDVAEKMVCPKCKGEKRHTISGSDAADDDDISCDQCGGDGYWWILSTIGHRAYPYWTCPISELHRADEHGTYGIIDWGVVPGFGPGDPPESLRDFYTIHDRQVAVKKPQPKFDDSLTLEDLGL